MKPTFAATKILISGPSVFGRASLPGSRLSPGRSLALLARGSFLRPFYARTRILPDDHLFDLSATVPPFRGAPSQLPLRLPRRQTPVRECPGARPLPQLRTAPSGGGAAPAPSALQRNSCVAREEALSAKHFAERRSFPLRESVGHVSRRRHDPPEAVALDRSAGTA